MVWPRSQHLCSDRFFWRTAFWIAAWCLALTLYSAEPNWSSTLAEARGQTVYWNAWAGDDRINRYLEWVAGEVKREFGIEVRHVKLADTAEAVTRVLAEKAARKNDQGSVDLIWINGENFAAMKRRDLLFGPFLERLPNYRWVDTNNLPTLTDFTVPVDGLEAPWSMAQFVFIYDRARLPSPPRSATALLAWAKANPGRFTYPQPPDFLGTTFLKQLLLNLTEKREALYAPASEAEFKEISQPLWAYLDQLHPVMWRQARAFPVNGSAQTRLLADGEIDVALAFSPEAASSAILTGQLPDTTRTFVFDGGTIGNASFLAIPFNSRAKAGAQVLINFLLSPTAQARKQDPRQLGSLTVLALDRLEPADRALFEKLPRGAATLSAQELGKSLAEPHPFWMERLEKEWQRRYGAGK
ncbi:MAG TPA: ABC transporter substrate-binding protein [Verrucomicrobiota bacterium]|nr:ABC transporter substrate-binding protein [Verrucomicrobiales bacterium]HRI15213.1 ABC transporter substrate-binding protein [Verrucomicrobiota bacterium]